MRIALEDALQEKQSSKILRSVSKAWNPGDTGIVLYPIYTDDEGKKHLLACKCRGHQCDFKALSLKTSFIPSNCKYDSYGNPLDGVGDIAYQFSKIAKCFVEGQKAIELKQLEQKQFPTESMRNQAIKTIEEKFDQTKMNSVKPVVKPLNYYISTECLYIPVKDGKPNVAAADIYLQKLSDARSQKLLQYMNDPKYAPIDGQDYLEVEYSFPTGDKNISGQTEPNGLTPEYRLKEKYPDEYKALLPKIQGLPTTSEMIEHRNTSYRRFSEQQIKAALSNYAIMSSQYLDALDEVENQEFFEYLEKNTGVIEELSIDKTLKNESLIAALKAAIEENHAKQAMEETTVPKEETVGTEEVNEDTQPMTVEQMLAEDHISSEDELSGIDIDG